MFTKEEAKQLNIDFWGGLNERLEKVRGEHGNKVNWMNFNTNVRHLYFRMEADTEGARLCIDLQFPDDGVREVFYEQFTEFKSILDKSLDGDVEWLEQFEHSNGKQISRIVVKKEGVNFLNKAHWEEMHSFLQTNFVKLEGFWSEFGEVFQNLK